ncbi:HXXEE domain-containing protein [Halanaerocella petrolearia]
MFEIIFLMSFTLHNIEEGIWLPMWSKYTGKYNKTVENNEFHFALLVVTVLGYLLTFLFLIFGSSYNIIKYLYLGFLLMMCFNAIFPHLLATVVLKRYAPGTITGLMLNLPIGLFIIFGKYRNEFEFSKLIIGFITITIIVLLLIHLSFKVGKRIIDTY